MFFKLTPEQAQKLEETIKARHPGWKIHGFSHLIGEMPVETYDSEVIEIIQQMQK